MRIVYGHYTASSDAYLLAANIPGTPGRSPGKGVADRRLQKSWRAVRGEERATYRGRAAADGTRSRTWSQPTLTKLLDLTCNASRTLETYVYGTHLRHIRGCLPLPPVRA